MTSVTDLSLIEVAASIRQGALSSEAVTKACLDRIARLNPAINAFIAIDAERALEHARAADARKAAGGSLGPLHGVPLAHKDMFYRAGEESTCGSIIRRGWKAPATADVLARLDRAGAITLGRLAMSEFAVGPIGLNAHYGPTRNPWNLAHVSGGSSSGPGAAVAAGLAFGALGSDTGASIRVPASACGVVGLKASAGLISTAGTMPLSSTLDVVGPIGRTVADVALLTSILAAPADQDLSTDAHPAFLAAATTTNPLNRNLRIGLPQNFFTDDLHPDVRDRFRELISILQGLGLATVEVDATPFAEGESLYGTIFGAEAAAFHSAFLQSRAADYSPQVRARLERGRTVLQQDYVAALARRSDLLRRTLNEVYDKVDVLIAPVLAAPPPTIAEVDVGDGERMIEVIRGFLRLTSPVNVLALPALSIPFGVAANGLPIGFQLIGTPWSDPDILRLGRAIEKATDWVRPSLSLSEPV